MQIKDVWEQTEIAREDSEVFLSTLLQQDRSWIFAHPDDDISSMHAEILESWMKRRQAGEPLAYILLWKEFFGRAFSVDPRVLIPRPATEGLVELALEMMEADSPARCERSVDSGIVAYGERWCRDDVQCIADIGTGSGCIAVTIACERPSRRIIASDTSDDALQVARENAIRHGVEERIEFRNGHLLQPLRAETNSFLIVANLPYVPEHHAIPRDVTCEPTSALFAGSDGLDLLLPLVRQAREHPACVGLVVECREDQLSRL